MQRSSGRDPNKSRQLNTSYGQQNWPGQSQSNAREVSDAPQQGFQPRSDNPFAFLNNHRGSYSSNFGVDRDAYLAELEGSRQPDIPLGPPRTTIAPNSLQRKPKYVYTSREIEGSNNDCVLAAFKSINRSVDQKQYHRLLTSEESAIEYLAGQYGLSKVHPSDLPMYLRDGKRAFINAESLDGNGYHAYAALGIDQKTGKIIAWDTDSNHANIKLVPTEKVWLAYAY